MTKDEVFMLKVGDEISNSFGMKSVVRYVDKFLLVVSYPKGTTSYYPEGCEFLTKVEPWKPFNRTFKLEAGGELTVEQKVGSTTRPRVLLTNRGNNWSLYLTVQDVSTLYHTLAELFKHPNPEV